MASVLKDTHKAFLMLQKSKFPAEQAESLVSVFELMDLSDLATKEDIQKLRLEMKFDLYRVVGTQTLLILGTMIAMFQFVN